MLKKYTIILFLLVLTSCYTKKEFLLLNKPAIYKLAGYRTYDYFIGVKYSKSIASSHFVYKNFDTFYVLFPNQTLRIIELRDPKEIDIIQSINDLEEINIKYNNCIYKDLVKKISKDTLILDTGLEPVEEIYVRILE
jgi:hypothetical protein